MREELSPEQALVGFCGGPFTVAGYVIEGRPTRDFVKMKTMMYREPAVWHALMEKLTETSSATCGRKVEAGADVIQVFDSWVGALSPADYEEFVAPYSARILDAVDVPTIHFGTGTRDAARVDGRGGRRRDRARLADPAGRGLGARRRGARRAGKPRPGAAARPVERIEAGAVDVLGAPPAARATSSTSATACSRTPIPPSSAAWSSSSTSEPPARSSRESWLPAPTRATILLPTAIVLRKSARVGGDSVPKCLTGR